MKTPVKRILFFLLFFLDLPGMIVTAQVILEKTYDHSLTVTKINQTEYKYYLMDVGLRQCRIYNLDHTLWKTVNITLPGNYYLFDIKFVTQDLFNTDTSVELWYSAYEYTTQETGRYTSGIINENGTVLASIPGGLYAYLNQAGEDVYKLAVYAYDNTVSPGTVKTHIFSFPGSSTAAAHVTAALGDPYPNPTAGSITLPLEAGSGNALLQVISINGQVLLEKTITGDPFYRLNSSGWKPGIYSYRLFKEGEYSETKLFVVQ
ncbi:MAG: T9SS type A sorting domain-containing protein [Prolixibacteraceae bacterium]|jgi:hypothetical protein|nr:T9SS type A sorting domain-containing protein [Bacteroidota bacterium]